MRVYFGFANLVGFGENDAERNFAFAHVFHEFQVDILGFVANVNQDKGANELLSCFEIIRYELLKNLFGFLGDFGITISRQIDQKPVVVNQKVVD